MSDAKCEHSPLRTSMGISSVALWSTASRTVRPTRTQLLQATPNGSLRHRPLPGNLIRNIFGHMFTTTGVRRWRHGNLILARTPRRSRSIDTSLYDPAQHVIYRVALKSPRRTHLRALDPRTVRCPALHDKPSRLPQPLGALAGPTASGLCTTYHVRNSSS